MQFEWDPEKNALLKETRNISFEAILVHIARGDIWKVADHPNQNDYPGQYILFVAVDNYIYLVPCEERNKIIRLITIIPSRKATKDYLKEQMKK